MITYAKVSTRRYDVEQLDSGEERSQHTMTKELMYCLINNILSSIWTILQESVLRQAFITLEETTIN